MENNSFLNNASSYLKKITRQTYISKAEILSLKKMMKKLAEADESYKTLFNRITTISNRALGKNEAHILAEFYETFQAEVAKNKYTDTLPEKVWTKKEYQGIPEGSCIHIQHQTDFVYEGTWSFMGGTSSVSIPKYLCSNTSILEETMKQVSEYLRDRK